MQIIPGDKISAVLFLAGLVVLSSSMAVSQEALVTDLSWDSDDDPTNPVTGDEYNQNNLNQWKAACGDDPNEYLIKEHTGDSLESQTDRNEYVCADRPTDCAYGDNVYSEGQLVDLGSDGGDLESGLPSDDYEVCLDLDNSVPGGEWYDMDADFLVNGSSRVSPQQFSEMEQYQHPSYWGVNPGTDLGRAPKGYATEDDCDEPKLNCDDSGGSTSSNQWFNAGKFTEGAQQDNNDIGGGIHNKVQDDSSQFEAGVDSDRIDKWNKIYSGTPWTNPMVNSDPGLDTWGFSSHLTDSIGNDGKSYDEGQCYYKPTVSSSDQRDSPGDSGVLKSDKVFGNSYADIEDFNDEGLNPDASQGVWKDPDVMNTADFSCDITGPDYGYGYDTGGPYNCKNGDCDRTYNENGAPFVVEGDITFDKDSGDSRTQSRDACGDDHYEYLLREKTNSEDPTFACADRTSDCVYNGEIYDEGALVDVSEGRSELGAQSVDEEICLDINNPNYEMGGPGQGGNWYDVDSSFVNSYIKGSSGNENNTDTYRVPVRESRDTRSGVIRDSVKWFKPNTSKAALEAKISPFNPIDYGAGYSLEDDISPDVTYAEDSGSSETRFEPDTVYSFFKDRYETDDRNRSEYDSDKRNSGELFTGMSARMWIGHADGTAFHQDGKSISQQNENTPSNIDYGYATSSGNVNVNDSTIDKLEDTWAIVNETNEVVGPTGNVYEDGKCYGGNPPRHSEGWIMKNETVVANSYAHSMDINGDGTSIEKGVWVDPDETVKSVSRGLLSCDLNSTDWGIGFDTGGSSLQVHRGSKVRQYGYDIDDRHAVSGPIAFDDGQKPLGENQDDLKQYPDVCGDDRNEFLIREQYSSYNGGEIYPNLTHRDNIYVCADRITDCAYDGAVYSEGQTLDISERSPDHTNPEIGENISDPEICLDLNKTTPGGEWYDMDQNLTAKNKIYALEDTFQMTSSISADRCEYDISGRVVGVDSQYGSVEIDGASRSVDSSGRFSYSSLEMGCDTLKRVEYRDVGYTQAQKKISLPDRDADIDNLIISKELTYRPIKTWENIQRFRDNYYGINPGTDWKNPSTRFDRQEVSYFNRTHSNQNRIQQRTLTSSIDRWASGEPNDFGAPPGEDCGEFYGNSGGTWNDIWCDKKQNALCEYPGYREYEKTAPKKWYVAKELCEAQGGHLAVIESAAENDYIEANYGNVLIGLHQPGPTPASVEPDQGWQWVNSSGTYQPEGYATEDDCGPLMRKSGTGPCSDVGTGTQEKPWFSAGNYSLGGAIP